MAHDNHQVLMYIYAVLGIYLLIDYSRSPTLPDLAWKFADIPHALLSLFQLLTLDQVKIPCHQHRTHARTHAPHANRDSSPVGVSGSHTHTFSTHANTTTFHPPSHSA